MSKFKTEAEMAAHVVQYLHTQNFEVFQEVNAPLGCADIVGRIAPLLWVVECKLTLNFDVIGQARRWTSQAHFVSVAVPFVRSREMGTVCEILQMFGIGLLEVHTDGVVWNRHLKDWRKTFGPTPESECMERIWKGVPYMDKRIMAAPFRRRIAPGLEKCLHEAQKTFAPAGTANGKRWTPFKSTCDELRKYALQNPGHTLKDVLGNITHHYTSQNSARACLARLILDGVVEGVELRKEGRQLCLYPIK